MASLVVAMNPRVKIFDEQILAILDEVFLTYSDLISPGAGLTLAGLLHTYNDDTNNVDRDFDALSICLPNPAFHEWRHKLGLNLFGSDAYDETFGAVCSRMGVQHGVGDENLNNVILHRSCKELGYTVCNIPRNDPTNNDCGWCCFGCRCDQKQAMANSGKDIILLGCKTSKIINSNQGKKNLATGAVFEYQNGWSKETKICVIESKVTVVAPVMLKKRGLGNPNIDKHLHLHPAVIFHPYPASFSSNPSTAIPGELFVPTLLEMAVLQNSFIVPSKELSRSVGF